MCAELTHKGLHEKISNIKYSDTEPSIKHVNGRLKVLHFFSAGALLCKRFGVKEVGVY